MSIHDAGYSWLGCIRLLQVACRVAQVLLYSCILTLYGLQQFGVPKVDLCRVLQQLYLIC